MAAPRYLSRAPINEALIDIRIKSAGNAKLDVLRSIHESIRTDYPKSKERKRFEGFIELSDEQVKQEGAFKGIDGYLYSSEDDKQTVQARLDGFTFNRVKPYGKWEDLRDEAKKLWEVYERAIRPELITRVALRYINQLEIPLPISDFADYLVSPPVVPQGLPQGVSSFLTRIVLKEPATDATVIIHQALESVLPSGIAPIILDIDVFRQITSGLEQNEAWTLLEQMRHVKNKVFFESVTEKTLELFI